MDVAIRFLGFGRLKPHRIPVLRSVHPEPPGSKPRCSLLVELARERLLCGRDLRVAVAALDQVVVPEMGRVLLTDDAGDGLPDLVEPTFLGSARKRWFVR